MIHTRNRESSLDVQPKSHGRENNREQTTVFLCPTRFGEPIRCSPASSQLRRSGVAFETGAVTSTRVPVLARRPREADQPLHLRKRIRYQMRLRQYERACRSENSLRTLRLPLAAAQADHTECW